MRVEVGSAFEAAFAARLRDELDAVPAGGVAAWPLMRRTRPIAFASAAAVAIGAALVVGTIGALAYASPLMKDAMRSFEALPHQRHSTGVTPTPHSTVAPSPSPAETERESPGPSSGEHESPEPSEPTRSSGTESPEPGEGTASPSAPDG